MTLDSPVLQAIATLPRVSLAHLPTPVHELPRLSESLGGVRILIKRDDLTGLATGGNKTRKLEFLIGDALENVADCVITAGGAQSNHCRQTAAAAAATGLDCHLVLGGIPPASPQGNLFLDQLLGAEVHWTEKTRRNERMQQLADQLLAEGRRPYVIPIGGSNGLGAIGYVLAMFELTRQVCELNRMVDCIIVAASSGGTLAGMTLGAQLAGFSGRVTAISIDQHPDDQFPQLVSTIANEAAALLACHDHITPDDVHLVYDYLGDGYGVVGDLERQAIGQLARSEGILVGPVYTSRALGGMIDMIQKGRIARDQTILFWHTGDESALHGYVESLGVEN